MYSFFAENSIFANIGLQKDDVVFYNATDSTNTRAREAFISSPEQCPRLFVAEEQTAGRGTRGRSFDSKKGGLYFSFLFSPEKEGYNASLITPLAAAAVFDALYSLLGKAHGKGLFIKWVNDLYIKTKKISGILSEKITKGEKVGYVIGIGINLTGSDFSPEVKAIAASVEEMTKITVDKEKLLYEILKRLIPALNSPKKTRLYRIYRRHSLKRGAKVTVTDSEKNTREAVVTGLDSELHLCVRYSDGERARLISGDVSIRL